MSFIRPEAAAELKRWREVIAAGALLALGLWWGLTAFGILRWIGWALVFAAGGLLWAAIQRARFRSGHGGVGVVEVDERQIAYLAPAGGGIASLDGLTRVSLGPDRAGLPIWRFHSSGDVLTIPTSAEGTEALFDVLTALPGVDMEAAIRASRSRPTEEVLIWQRERIGSVPKNFVTKP